MPPKKGSEPSKKTLEKEKKQAIEDKTFGLKNKSKSKRVQQYVESVQKQMAQKYQAQPKQSQSQAEQAAKQKEEQRKAQLLAQLRATLRQPPVPPGGNPKDYLCVFFANGICDKGDKCKYSHDLGAKAKPDAKVAAPEEAPPDEETKVTMISEAMGSLNIYREMRDQILEYNARQAAHKQGKPYEEVLERYRAQEKAKAATQNQSPKVCNYFMMACKRKEIGWGFKCPNEEKFGYCQYRHCLPEGFEFPDEKKAAAQQEDSDLDNELLEDEIERKRSLITSGTPVTAESFQEWKRARAQRKQEEAAAKQAELDRAARQKGPVETWFGLSGKAMFESNPEWLSTAEADVTAPADPGADSWLRDREDLKRVNGEEVEEGGNDGEEAENEQPTAVEAAGDAAPGEASPGSSAAAQEAQETREAQETPQ